MQIRPAGIDDLAAMEALLHAAALPTQGICDQFPEAYWIACQSGRPIGAVGLERYGSYGLLRSLVVAEDARRRAVGTALVRRALDLAATQLQAVFLLTTTAPAFFLRMAFTPLPRDEVPPEVASAPEFARICPSTAACLMWEPPR